MGFLYGGNYMIFYRILHEDADKVWLMVYDEESMKIYKEIMDCHKFYTDWSYMKYPIKYNEIDWFDW